MSFVLPDWVSDLRPLADFAHTLTNFARDPSGFVISIIEEYLVSGILAGWRWFLANVVTAVFEAIELGLVDGIAIPLRDGFTMAGGSLYDALVQLRLWAESGLVEFGVAAPFALAVSWLFLAVIVAGITQLLWGFIETYLPVSSVTGAVDAIRTALAGDES
ncbi:hypothetical protein [Halorubrum salinum]|uniref:hypothetical protein n=1 Tax=Halorubrum salinum TaxID=767517 RepID=UPI002112F859|nr:hypothetical protein [Halorubrum salinum]